MTAQPAPPPPGVIEVQPAPPSPHGRKLLYEGQYRRRWRMIADPAAGTLTVLHQGRDPKIFPLAASGRADAVTTVCLTIHHWFFRDPRYGDRSGYLFRMLLLDSQNRLVWAAKPWDYPDSLRLFPPEIFEPLRSAGLSVVTESYSSPHALEEAHPGSVIPLILRAERHPLTAAWKPALVITAIVAVLVTVIFLAVT